MHGLKKMVQLRGGLEMFRSKRVLYNMILRYQSPPISRDYRIRLISNSTDLCGSIDAERKPFFDEVGVSTVTTKDSYAYISKGFHEINNHVHFSNAFNQILRRVEDSTDALNMLRGGNTLCPLDLRDELTSIQYALLCMECSEHVLNESKVQRICRQGLLLYLATVLNGLPSIASNFDMIGANLVAALQHTFDETGLIQGLRLWLVLIIAIIVCDKTSKSWAQREFATIIRSSFPHKQEEVKARLETFFWVEKIHGSRLYELWNKTFGGKESQSVYARKRSSDTYDYVLPISL